MSANLSDRFFARNLHGQTRTTPLTDAELRHFAPSIFAEEKHESRSERFAYIPTFEVLAGMRKEGFLPVKATQGKSRVPGKSDFTKHMIRFRREDDLTAPVAPEVIMVNAHDGTSAYKLMAGIFRFVCLNGLVCVEEDHGSIKVHHKGDVISKVIDGSYTVINDGRERVKIAADWQGVTLNTEERKIMAESAHMIRFGEEGSLGESIRPERLLTVRRRDDTSPNLWTTYNVIQENVIRGGISGQTTRTDEVTGQRTTRRTSSRAINGIDQDIKLNAALHHLASRMAELKGVAA